MFKKLTACISFLLLSCLLSTGCQFVANHPKGPHFERTGDMNIARVGHTATLLPNGNVLIAGGNLSKALGSTIIEPPQARQAELYIPKDHRFVLTGMMKTWHKNGELDKDITSPLLPNGKVLFIGSGAAKTELYDPKTEQFYLTGQLIAPNRQGYTVTLLKTGKVLVTGGEFWRSQSGKGEFPVRLNSAELYDPATEKFSLIGNMNFPRSHHYATLMQDGRVLITGGMLFSDQNSDIAEIYDPTTGNFTKTGKMPHELINYEATSLPNGNVLLFSGNQGYRETNPIVVYHPNVGKFFEIGKLGRPLGCSVATLLANSKILYTGGNVPGFGASAVTDKAELYNPNTHKIQTIQMLSKRIRHTATLLRDGNVLVTGGFSYTDDPVKSAELFSY